MLNLKAECTSSVPKVIILGMAYFQQCDVFNLTSLCLFENESKTGCYILHYINRDLIYPLQMAAGKPMPLSVMIMAFVSFELNPAAAIII